MGVEIFKVMRELKFRVWDGNKMWLPESETANGTNTTLHFFNSLRCIVWGLYDSVFGNRIATSEYHELMQYTGLKDKNGKEIYEGDVVEINDSGVRFGVYEFVNGTFKISGTETISSTFSKVIGNIHENPELL